VTQETLISSELDVTTAFKENIVECPISKYVFAKVVFADNGTEILPDYLASLMTIDDTGLLRFLNFRDPVPQLHIYVNSSAGIESDLWHTTLVATLTIHALILDLPLPVNVPPYFVTPLQTLVFHFAPSEIGTVAKTFTFPETADKENKTV